MTGQVAEKTKEDTPKTYVAILLDKSSSMSSIRDEARRTYNEQLQTIRDQAEGQEISLIHTQFASEVEYIFFNQNISVARDLEEDDYKPSGMTAFFDAIGMTIDQMKAEISDLDEDRVSVLFVVISDGYENCSKEYPRNQPSKIQAKIKEMQDTGRWTFTFLAANVDVMKLADQMGVDVGNTRSFAASKDGMMAGSSAASRGMGRYLGSRSTYSSANAAPESKSVVDFFEENTDDVADDSDSTGETE